MGKKTVRDKGQTVPRNYGVCFLVEVFISLQFCHKGHNSALITIVHKMVFHVVFVRNRHDFKFSDTTVLQWPGKNCIKPKISEVLLL